MDEMDYDKLMNEALKEARPKPLPWVLLALALVAAGAGAFYLLRRLDAVRTDAAASGSMVASLQDQLNKEKAAKQDLGQQREKLEAENKDLRAGKEDLAKNVQAKDEELAKLKATSDELQEKMKSEIAQGEIQLTNSEGRLKVDLIDKVLFDSGEAQISKRGEGVLSRVGAVLARVENRQIQVSGHTDDAPISARLVNLYPTNWELSAARAIHVVRFLEEKAGVPGKRLAAAGYGPHRPIASNSKPSGRARNRRIEIVLTPTFEPRPAKVAAAAATPGSEAAQTPPGNRMKHKRSRKR